MIRSTFDSVKSYDFIWIDQDDISVCCRREERPNIVSVSNVDLFMSRTKYIIVV